MKYTRILISLIFLSTVFYGCCCGDKGVSSLAVISEHPEALTSEEIAGKRLTPEILWKFGRIGEYVVSYDEKSVAYAVTRYSLSENRGRTTIWNISADGGEAVCLTADVASNCVNPRWTPSGRLMYLNAADDGMQIWSMSPNGSDKKQLSFIEGGINGFELSPVGDAVLFFKKVNTGGSPKEQYPDLPHANAITSDYMMYRHWDSWTD